MQTALCRFWNCISEFNFSDDNPWATLPSKLPKYKRIFTQYLSYFCRFLSLLQSARLKQRHYHQVSLTVGMPRLFLSIHPNGPSILEGPQDIIQCPFRVDVCWSPTLVFSCVAAHRPNVAFVFPLISPAVPRMSCLSSLDCLWDVS